MNFLKYVCFIALLFAFTGELFASEKLYSQLDRAYEVSPNQVNEVLKKEKIFSSPEKIMDVSLWVRGKHFKTKDPYLAKLYAVILKIMITGIENSGKYDDALPLKETASLVYLNGYLITLEDIKRCKDKSAGQMEVVSWKRDLVAYKKYFDELAPEKKRKIISTVITLSQSRDVNKKNKAICSTGADFYVRAMSDDSFQKENCKTTKTGESTNVTCDNEFLVNEDDFIADSEWDILRVELWDKFRETFVK